MHAHCKNFVSILMLNYARPVTDAHARAQVSLMHAPTIMNV